MSNSQKVTIFEISIFTDVNKVRILRENLPELSWALNPMTHVLIKVTKGGNRKKDLEKRSCDDGPRMKLPGPGNTGGKKEGFLQSFQRKCGLAAILMSDSSLQSCERINCCCLKPPSVY